MTTTETCPEPVRGQRMSFVLASLVIVAGSALAVGALFGVLFAGLSFLGLSSDASGGCGGG